MSTRRLFVIDSIATITREMAGGVVVSGSHGGLSAAHFVLALPYPPHAVFFNDAGVGKDRAGIAGLPLLDTVGVMAATCAHTSARIGEASDGLACGILSHVNACAQSSGWAPGQTIAEQVRRLCGEVDNFLPCLPRA